MEQLMSSLADVLFNYIISYYIWAKTESPLAKILHWGNLRKLHFCPFLVDFHPVWLFFTYYVFLHFLGNLLGWDGGWAWANFEFLHILRFVSLVYFGRFWGTFGFQWRGVGVKPMFKEFCCKFCIILEAIWQYNPLHNCSKRGRGVKGRLNNVKN